MFLFLFLVVVVVVVDVDDAVARSEVLKCIHMFEVFFYFVVDVVVARCCYFVVFTFALYSTLHITVKT